jgi:pilus assembly protein CpaB
VKTRLALAASVILGIIAALGLRVYMLRLKEEKGRGENLIPVVTAKVGLPKGEPITSADVLELKSVPENLVSRNHIQEHQQHRLIGMRPQFNIDRGEILLWTHFVAQVDIKDQASTKLKKGERALTLKVDQITGVAGLILPGSRVDIFGTFQQEAAQAQESMTYTRPVLYNVPVIAVDNQTSLLSIQSDRRLEQGGYSSVTLAVTPRAARLLTFAQANGQLTLVLRRPEDTDVEEETEVITSGNLNAIADALIQEERGPGGAGGEKDETRGLGKAPGEQ